MQLLVRPLLLVEHAPTAPDMLSISIACVGIPGAVLHHRVACLALSGILTLIYYNTNNNSKNNNHCHNNQNNNNNDTTLWYPSTSTLKVFLGQPMSCRQLSGRSTKLPFLVQLGCQLDVPCADFPESPIPLN